MPDPNCTACGGSGAVPVEVNGVRGVTSCPACVPPVSQTAQPPEAPPSPLATVERVVEAAIPLVLEKLVPIVERLLEEKLSGR